MTVVLPELSHEHKRTPSKLRTEREFLLQQLPESQIQSEKLAEVKKTFSICNNRVNKIATEALRALEYAKSGKNPEFSQRTAKSLERYERERHFFIPWKNNDFYTDDFTPMHMIHFNRGSHDTVMFWEIMHFALLAQKEAEHSSDFLYTREYLVPLIHYFVTAVKKPDELIAADNSRHELVIRENEQLAHQQAIQMRMFKLRDSTDPTMRFRAVATIPPYLRYFLPVVDAGVVTSERAELLTDGPNNFYNLIQSYTAYESQRGLALAKLLAIKEQPLP